MDFKCTSPDSQMDAPLSGNKSIVSFRKKWLNACHYLFDKFEFLVIIPCYIYLILSKNSSWSYVFNEIMVCVLVLPDR